MPSHTCHEWFGSLLGLDSEAVKTANRVIDFPEKYLPQPFREVGAEIGHDDSRKWAMDFVRDYLRQLYGHNGVLAADLHYALDYIERWLDPEKARRMLEAMEAELLYPPDRRGVVDPVRRLWYPDSARAGGRRVLPITAYCKVCKGEKKLINSPFCDRCWVTTLRLPELSEIPMEFLTLMFRRFAEKRELSQDVVRFVEGNMTRIIGKIAKDRKRRGFSSLRIV